MSKRLKIRILKLNELPYGIYTWIVTISQEYNNIKREDTNEFRIEPLKQILENAGSGKWKFSYVINFRKQKIYNKIYLTSGMDVALLKMCHSDLLRKIYKIELRKD